MSAFVNRGDDLKRLVDGGDGMALRTARDTESLIRLISYAVMLIIQGAVLYLAITMKVDEMSRDNRRILRAENTEHMRLWNAMGQPAMFNYIEPIEPSESALRRVTP